MLQSSLWESFSYGPADYPAASGRQLTLPAASSAAPPCTLRGSNTPPIMQPHQEHASTLPIPPDDLHEVTPATAQDEQMPSERVQIAPHRPGRMLTEMAGQAPSKSSH